MAEEQGASFTPGELEPAKEMIQTGAELRRTYVLRKTATEMGLREIATLPPYTEEELASFKAEWKLEADRLYPDQGDYKVIVRDELGELIPIGSEVIFIGGPIRENPGFPNYPEGCDQYSWDVTAIPDATVVNLSYRDCETIVVNLSGPASDFKPLSQFCSIEAGSIITADGIVTLVGPCSL